MKDIGYFIMFILCSSLIFFTREMVLAAATMAAFATPNVSEFILYRLQTPRSGSRLIYYLAQNLPFSTTVLHACINQSTIRWRLGLVVLDGCSSV